MSDIFTKKKRSEVMARVRSSGNRDTEVALARWFRREGITGWRRKQRVFGKPDFVFWRERVAVFVDGCFWHGCPRHGTLPKQNGSFWAAKLARNRARDRLVARTLRRAGWRVVRIWEHALTKGKIENLKFEIRNGGRGQIILPQRAQRAQRDGAKLKA